MLWKEASYKFRIQNVFFFREARILFREYLISFHTAEKGRYFNTEIIQDK